MRADSTTRAQVCVNFDPLIPDVESRAGEGADAIFVILTFCTYVKRLTFGQLQGIGIQGTDFFRYDYRNALVIDGRFDRLDAFLYLIRFDGGDMVHTDGLHHSFDGYFAVSFHVQLGHVDPGIGLMSGHSRGTVVENNQGKVMAVKDGIDQAWDCLLYTSDAADECCGV